MVMELESSYRVKIALLFLVASLFIFNGCSCSGKKEMEHFSFKNSFVAEDSLSQYNLYIFTRLPIKESDSDISAILTVTTPVGEKFRDTLLLPLVIGGVGAKSVETGIWRDWLWPYRRDITFNYLGEWFFELELTLPYSMPRDGAAVIVKSSKNGKK